MRDVMPLTCIHMLFVDSSDYSGLLVKVWLLAEYAVFHL